ncbi:hypothetical protein HG536_0D01740 [Torulaspora globosa]|uniref:Tetrapyrrole biosynthesis uroporphyrinogen III synthase domain-containing protein n=1 Tax=Torulaspora globosa TaxID=48254 RepID=A0A7G3ZGL6_9SACH|nr:uncharacterized protein HG536_0D01740 [Torulaspora globosa]QLL32652.1 hypothetical protein HG536_0D01740 [Torulaspora globosa]
MRQMRVLLLKNKTAQLDNYEVAFKSNGYETFFVPLIAHTHVPEELLGLINDKDYVESLKNIVVSSQRTVECLSESVLPKLNSATAEMLLSKTVYAVGAATEEFLARIGFKNVKGGKNAGTGSILADLITQDLLEQGQEAARDSEILSLVGQIRRDVIPNKLSSKGFKVKEVVTYQTVNLEDNLERFQKVVSPHSWVVLFSPQGTEEILLELKKHPDTKIKIASIGPTTEKYLNENGIQPQVVSPKPDSNSLLNAIKLSEEN